jgi:hypothetical protein
MSLSVEMVQPIHDRQGRIAAIRGHVSAAYEPKPQHIDVTDCDQVVHWSRYFGTTPLQLCNAVDKVGSNAMVVQRLLRTR